MADERLHRRMWSVLLASVCPSDNLVWVLVTCKGRYLIQSGKSTKKWVQHTKKMKWASILKKVSRRGEKEGTWAKAKRRQTPQNLVPELGILFLPIFFYHVFLYLWMCTMHVPGALQKRRCQIPQNVSYIHLWVLCMRTPQAHLQTYSCCRRIHGLCRRIGLDLLRSMGPSGCAPGFSRYSWHNRAQHSFDDARHGGNHDPRGKARDLSSPSVLMWVVLEAPCLLSGWVGGALSSASMEARTSWLIIWNKWPFLSLE